MRIRGLALLTAMILGPAAFAGAADDDFKPLFNGTDLTGWVGDNELWSVEDGKIVGTTDNKKLKHNSFLATEKSYKNFVIKAKFKLRNHNSGIQIRSKLHDDYVVKGYQPDIDEAGKYTGGLYEEGGRGVLALPGQGSLEHFNKGDWNDYEITADGPNIKIQLNGFTSVDYTEKDEVKGAKEGIIALQLHQGAGMRVEFKDIMIKELP